MASLLGKPRSCALKPTPPSHVFHTVTSTPATTTCNTVLAGERVCLHPHAGLYWEAADTLILADLHLGKATHFRRHGMPVPQYVQDETLDKLTGLLLDYRPARLLILGDLFHSDYNEEWEDFADVILGFPDVRFELVLGNHDRLTRHQYEKYGIRVLEEPHVEGPFAFSHHPMTREELAEALPGIDSSQLYNLAGHVHPSARLFGRGDSLRLPCFYFAREAGLLPAFGAFTGTYCVSPRRGDRVFMLAGESVVEAS